MAKQTPAWHDQMLDEANRIPAGEIECCPRCLKLARLGKRFDARLTHLLHREEES